MKTKVYGNIVKEVVEKRLTETLDTYGRDGYKLVSVVPKETSLTYLLFMTKEYTEND